MTLSIRQAIVYAAFTLGLVLAVLIIGSVIEIFDDPNSETSRTIGEFETYLGAVIAFTAAMLTIIVIYVSAKLQVDADHQRNVDQQDRLEKAGASVLLAQIKALGAGVDIASELADNYLVDDANVRPKIFIPMQLIDFEIVSSQPVEISKKIAGAVSHAIFLNKMAENGFVSTTPKEQKESLDLINEITGDTGILCVDAKKLLEAIVDK